MNLDISMESICLILSVIGGLVLYFIRLESRLARIITDLCWIKKQLSRRRTDGQDRKEVFADNSGS
jgi:hypothetical protein